MSTAGRPEVLLIGGRSGVGKSTTALALHDLLAGAGVRHVVIEGDFLDLAWPPPHREHPEAQLAARNLAAVWANARTLGHHRLVFTNTVAVLESAVLARAVGDDPHVTAVLLRAPDEVVRDRLGRRVGGTAADADLQHSAETARRLDRTVAEDVVRIETDRRTPSDVAQELGRLTGWLA
jgi:predicted kinase